jgi:hypothetical protein
LFQCCAVETDGDGDGAGCNVRRNGGF